MTNIEDVIEIADLREFEQKSEQFREKVVSHFEGQNKENVLWLLMAEIGDNIKQHSRAKHAIMDFSLRSDEIADIVISDTGIGIGGSFRKAGLDMDDRTALKKALEGTSTKKAEGNRGWGLRTTVALVEELKGNLQIDSGNASVVIEGGEVVEIPRTKSKGTTVILALPRKLEISQDKFYSIVEGNK